MNGKVLIGVIGRTYGIKGYVTVKSYSDFPERFTTMKEIKLTNGRGEDVFHIENAYIRNNRVYLKFKGVDSREDAMRFNGRKIFINKDERVKLEEERYYISDLIGYDVFDAKTECIGVIKDIINNGATDILVIRDGKTENLVPMVKEFIDTIDIENKKVVISPIEGMIDAH
ncbi:MAG: 16S rRNA processing protein RimM [Proteobacteria bacterium]|nr:16S rRNA processing protein RimM [Pseudomonadota bacterium]